MTLPMRMIAIVLACLACVGLGRSEKIAIKHMQEGSYEERGVSQNAGETMPSSHLLQESGANVGVEVPNPVKGLAMFLVRLSNPAAVFSPPNLMPVAGPCRDLPIKNPNDANTARHSAIRMKEKDGSGWNERPPVPELQQERTVTPKEKRVPWEWQRFIQQASRFIEPPWQRFIPKNEVARVLAPGDSFGQLQLFPLDDVVMGGASASTFDNGSRKWTGEVTSRNSGGFVGIRAKTLEPLDLAGTEGIELKLRPDGRERRFKFILRDNTDFNGITWTASFTIGSPQARLASPASSMTGGVNGVESVRIPYSSLIPTIFAKTVPNVSIDLTNIVGVQLALSKFEYNGDLNPLFEEGTFELDVLDVATY